MSGLFGPIEADPGKAAELLDEFSGHPDITTYRALGALEAYVELLSEARDMEEAQRLLSHALAVIAARAAAWQSEESDN